MSMTLAAAIFLAATTAPPAALPSAAPPPGPQAEAAILKIESETVAAYLKGAGKETRTASPALVVEADADAPYLLPCDTPEEFCSIDADINCADVSPATGTGSSTRGRPK